MCAKIFNASYLESHSTDHSNTAVPSLGESRIRVISLEQLYMSDSRWLLFPLSSSDPTEIHHFS